MENFVKRRFFPVLLALLVVFFSVVIPVSRVEASPAPVLPPTFEVIPGGAVSGLTYYDVASSIFAPAGIDIKMADGKSFEKELWDEICDTFNIWAEQNVSDFKELGAELSGLVSDAVDGTINMSKKLFEALQKYGKEAADWVKAHTSGDSDISPSKLGYVSFDYLDFLTSGSYSAYFKRIYGYSESELLSYKNEFDSCKYKYFVLFRDQFMISGGVHDIYFFNFTRLASYPYYYISSPRSVILTDALGTYGGPAAYHIFPFTGSYYSRYNWDGYLLSSSTPVVATNMTEVAPPASSGNPVSPVQPPYPVSHIVFTPRPDPVTWPDYVAIAVPDADPDSLPDSAPVPVPHRNPVTGEIIEPNPDPEPDPDPEPGTDPDPAENVDPDQIAGLPDKITAAGDIKKLFPFCIPFDIVALVKSMKTEKAPPVWHFEYYFKQIDYKFEVTVDMSQYEVYVKIFRSGFVILYIITLMLLTIRYSSGIAKD